MFIDPDGRKALVNDYQAMQAEYTGFIESQGNGVMGQMLGGGGRLTTSYYPGNLGSGGSGAFGGLTANTPSSVNNLMSYFNSNGSTSNSIDYLFNNYKSGYITWWTGGAEGNANTSQEMVAHMLNLNKSGIPEIREPSFYIPSQNGFFDWGNLGNAATAGAISYYALEKSIYSKQHWVDAKGIIKSTKILEKGANGKFVRGVQGLRNGYAAAGKATSVYSVAGKVVGFVGVGVTVWEIASGKKNLVGEGGLDLVMGGIGFTPWGAPVSLIYFGGKFALEATGNDFWNK